MLQENVITKKKKRNKFFTCFIFVDCHDVFSDSFLNAFLTLYSKGKSN